MQIGQRIRELREKRGWTQGDVERASGMLRAYISRVEHGHTLPSLESLERFAAALQLPMHDLFRDVSSTAEEIPTTNGDAPMVGLLSAYVHQMSTEERKVLLSLAELLAK